MSAEDAIRDALSRYLASRRDDPEFMARLHKRIEEDRHILDRLADPSPAPGDVASPAEPPAPPPVRYPGVSDVQRGTASAGEAPTIHVSIGNSDDRLTQARWSAYRAEVDTLIRRHAALVHGAWVSPSADPWQNACWAFTLKPRGTIHEMSLRVGLRLCAERYEQDTVAWNESVTEFLPGHVCGGRDPAYPGQTCPLPPKHPGGCFGDPDVDA